MPRINFTNPFRNRHANNSPEQNLQANASQRQSPSNTETSPQENQTSNNQEQDVQQQNNNETAALARMQNEQRIRQTLQRASLIETISTRDSAQQTVTNTRETRAVGKFTNDPVLTMRWKEIGQAQPPEKNLSTFIAFLERLDTSINNESPEFKNVVASFLNEMAENKELRSKLIALSNDVRSNFDTEFTSCQDGAALVFSNMIKEKHIDNIESGKYDGDLGKVIEISFENSRTDRLNTLAAGFVEELKQEGTRYIDEVEEFLALPVKLNQILELDYNPIKTMEFGSRAEEPEELVNFAKLIFEQEGDAKQRMLDLMDYIPMALLERMAPNGYSYENMMDEIIENYSEGKDAGDTFSKETKLEFFNQILKEHNVSWPEKLTKAAPQESEIREKLPDY